MALYTINGSRTTILRRLTLPARNVWTIHGGESCQEAASRYHNDNATMFSSNWSSADYDAPWRSSLSDPLLGELPPRSESCCSRDVERACSCACCQDSSCRCHEDINDDDTNTCSSDSVLTVLVLPLLLLIQFGLPYFAHRDNPEYLQAAFPSLTIVVASIILFAAASLLYKCSLRITSVQNMVSVLLPEIWMNAVLAYILLTQDTTRALQLLLTGNLVLAACGVIRGLMDVCEEDDDDELDVVNDEPAKEVVVPVVSCCGATNEC